MRQRAVFFLILFLSGCSNRKDIPDDILQPRAMQKIMRDIVEAQEFSAEYISKDSLKPDKMKANQELLDTIFKIHHISRQDFKASLQFYESRPDLNKNLFDSLTADANRRRPELYAPKLKPVLPGKKPEK